MVLVDTEMVLVVPTELFHELGLFQGFSPDVDRYLPGLFECGRMSYRPRGEMECDPSFKQLIPYVLFQYSKADGGLELFQYARGTGQGEVRLHTKRSVGVGGHISTVDAEMARCESTSAVYSEGMRRELAEEVLIDSAYRERCVGLINDDATEVGSVHLGVVHVCEVERPTVRPREHDIADAGFRPLQEIVDHLDEFETWSQIAVRALYG